MLSTPRYAREFERVNLIKNLIVPLCVIFDQGSDKSKDHRNKQVLLQQEQTHFQ